MQRRRLPQDESRLPYPPPARRKRRPPGRGVVRKGGESPAPAREHPPHRSAWVKPSDRSAEGGVGGTLGERVDAVELQLLAPWRG